MKHVLQIFAAGARDGVYPGGQLAVSVECQPMLSVCVGRLGAGLPETATDTLYDLSSLTKPLVTTVLLGQALQQGRCRLEDPVARFVPEVPEGITIATCLDHSAGFVAHERFDLALDQEIEPGTWPAWRAIVQMAARARPVRPVGVEAVYSDIGFILLGAALEVMLGMPLSSAALLLGTQLHFRDRRGPPAVPPAPSHQMIAPTEGSKAGWVHDENARAMGGAAGHAGAFGTAEAVLRLAEDLVLSYHGWGGGLLKTETIRRLWEPSGVPGSTRTLGWDRPSPEGSSTGGRWPRHSVGHLGFTGTSLWIEPDRALIGVLITNRVCPSRANNLIRRLRPSLYDAIWEEWGARATVRKRPTPCGIEHEAPTVRIER